MNDAATVQITLQPNDRKLRIPIGAPLQDVLFSSGVEFPCGGKGLCRGCRIRAINGNLPITSMQEKRLSEDELQQGWRLACQCQAESDLTLEIAQWGMAILSDDHFVEFTPRPGFGVAVDLGTTTIVAQLLNLNTGCVESVYSTLNPQAEFGADLISRIQYDMQHDAHTLTSRIRSCISDAVHSLLQQTDVSPANLNEIVLAGNTVMHHLFCGLDVKPLSQAPFQSPYDGQANFTATELGWSNLPNAAVIFLPALGGFVGSDLLAGIIATGIHQSERPCALIDLGTNGEIIIGNRKKTVCASTAVGPAFEGGRIRFGMRAATGAISQVEAKGGELQCNINGNGKAKGICGSGLVEAVAASLELSWIHPSGRILLQEKIIPLADGIYLTQQDVRQLQLAKAAIAAGFTILLEEWGTTPDDLGAIYLAGAFGNYINLIAAKRIGLLPLPAQRLTPVGNSSLRGAKCVLCQNRDAANSFERILQITNHFTLSEHPAFQDLYVSSMTFPD